MDRIGILGTGQVGLTLAERLASLGFRVAVGARTSDSDSLAEAAQLGVATGSFADAAASADLLINATNGLHSVDALAAVGEATLTGLTVLDLANALAPNPDGFPTPVVSADDSVGQRLQRAFPGARIVKSLCTMNCAVMADPSLVPGDHVAFLSGDAAAAKDQVRELLQAMGWRPLQLIDLGGIETAAAQEMLMPLWMRVTIGRGSSAARFNWAINAADRD
ncbi:MAG: NAD(P)-binding domain-containing protein [Micropruina sp.]